VTDSAPALRPGTGTVAALFLLCILIRLPFWFPSTIDWDESTFILMGQELLDGRLPYVELWDNKPPLAFAAFTVFIALHPSIVAVRVAGALCVFLSALLTYSVARRIGNATAAALAVVGGTSVAARAGREAIRDVGRLTSRQRNATLG
jgi:4-amino-4-deoxy-L-arabinose transferase-like glycosyltransferase